MRTSLRTVALPAALLFGLTLTSAVSADPNLTAAGTKEQVAKAARERKEAEMKRKEAREKTAEALKSGKAEDREAAKKARKEARRETSEAHKATMDAVKARWAKLRETRKERRQERRDKIKEKWGEDVTGRPAVQAALKIHAWRMARLRRIRAIAEEAKRDEVVKRVDELIKKEEARHQRHMETLKSVPADKVQPAATTAPAPGESDKAGAQ